MTAAHASSRAAHAYEQLVPRNGANDRDLRDPSVSADGISLAHWTARAVRKTTSDLLRVESGTAMIRVNSPITRDGILMRLDNDARITPTARTTLD